jgi:hypothetical protein
MDYLTMAELVSRLTGADVAMARAGLPILAADVGMLAPIDLLAARLQLSTARLR